MTLAVRVAADSHAPATAQLLVHGAGYNQRPDPDLVIAAMLTAAIPPMSGRPPGSSSIRGRGATVARPRPASWAIMDGAARWGVTVLQASGPDVGRVHLAWHVR